MEPALAIFRHNAEYDMALRLRREQEPCDPLCDMDTSDIYNKLLCAQHALRRQQNAHNVHGLPDTVSYHKYFRIVAYQRRAVYERGAANVYDNGRMQ